MWRLVVLWCMVLVCGLLGLGGEATTGQTVGGYERADIEYGLTVYRSQCATCHGEAGNAVPGVDFRSGQFRRVSSDREIRALLATGIPESGMPPADLDASESVGIIAYLRNMNFDPGGVTLGDAARGRLVFEGKGACMQCHRVKGRGPRVAPELTAIGRLRAPSTLRRSLLDPTASMRPINRPVELVTADGNRVSGRRLNEDLSLIHI